MTKKYKNTLNLPGGLSGHGVASQPQNAVYKSGSDDQSVTKGDVERVLQTFSDFKAAYTEDQREMQEQVENVLMVQNRLDMFGGGPSDRQMKEESAAFRHFAKTGDESRMAAMTESSDPDGGYLVMPSRSQEMTKKLFDSSPMRRLSRNETIEDGSAWEEPVDKDEVGAAWVSESESRTATDTPQLGLLNVPVHESYALIPLTQRLIDDSYIDLFGWMNGKIVDKFARQEGTAFISGDGIKKPMGFLSYPVSADADSDRDWGTLQYVVSGAASSVTADALQNQLYTLRAPYRMGASWLMASSTALVISKLKNDDGDYIWRESFAAGQPATLLGFPVEIAEDMPAVSAGNYPIAFGNFQLGYVTVDKLGTRFLRDPYSSKPNVLIYAYRRVGGGLANSEAIKLMKIAAE